MKKFKHRLLAFVVAFCAFVSGINAQPIITDDFSTAASLNNWEILPPLRTDINVVGSDAIWHSVNGNGNLKMRTLGGSDGEWGVANSTRIGPNYFNTPTNWTNTETEFRIQELPRVSLGGYKECVVYSYIIGLDDNNYISIELNGNHYGYDFITVPGHPYGVDNAHRLLLRTPNSRQHILNQSLALNLYQDYTYDFKITNLNNVWSVSYKQSSETNWPPPLTISGLTNPSGLTTVKPYFMIWSGDGGNTRQNGSGAFNIDYYKVSSIATIPSVTIAITTGSQTICAGTSVTFTATPTNGGTAPTYQWIKNNTIVGTDVTYTTTGLANGDVITCVMTSNAVNISPTTATSATITMTVNALPTVTGIANQTVCAGNNTVPITFTGTGATSYTWTNSNTATGLAASGTGNIPAFATTNSTTAAITSTVTVTPVNGSTSYAYIANFGSNTVSVINTTTNMIEATVTVGQSPVGVSVSPNGSRVYVTNFSSNTVSVIETINNTVVATIPVGTHPFGVAVTPNGNFVYVANQASGNISVINTSTNAVVATVSVSSEPLGVSVSPDGNFVYITRHLALAVIRTSDNTVVRREPLTTPAFGVAISPNSRYIYLANYDTHSISVIDASTNYSVVTILVGTNPTGVAVSPNGNYLYVTNQGSNTVSVISTMNNTVVATVPVQLNPYGVSLNPDGSRVYVTNYYSGTVSTIETTTNTVVATVLVHVDAGPTSLGNFIRAGLSCPSTPTTFTLTVNPLPTVNIASNNGLALTCTTPSTILTASGAGTYLWSTGAITPSITSNVTVTTPYTVTVTNASGCTAIASTTVTVNKTLPTVSAGANVTINCSTPNTVLLATGTAGNTYTWSSGTQGGTVMPTTTRTYTVTATGANGCTKTASKVVTVNKQVPTVNAGANTTITCATSSDITLNATGTAGSTYTWNIGTQNSVQTPPVTTTYTVTATAANGCTAVASRTVTVDKTLPIVNVGADVSICAGTATLIGSAAIAGQTYSWSPNTSTLANPSVSPTITTTYTVTVRKTANACTATGTVTVSVRPTVTNSSVSANGSLIVCSGAPINLILTSNATGPNLTYQWARNNVAIAGATTSSVTATATGTYRCTITNGCGSITSDNIRVGTPTLLVGGNCIGQPVTVVSNSTIATVSWERRDCGTTSFLPISINSASFIPTLSGQYRALVTFAQVGCPAQYSLITSCINVCNLAQPVKTKDEIFAEYYKNLSSDQLLIENNTLTNQNLLAIQDENIQGTSLFISPNPVNTFAHVKIDLAQAGRIRLVLSNATGVQKVLLDENKEAGTHFTTLEDEIAELPNGIYFLTLETADKILSEKIVKID